MIQTIRLPDIFYKLYHYFIRHFLRMMIVFMEPFQIDTCTVFVLSDGVYMIFLLLQMAF